MAELVENVNEVSGSATMKRIGRRREPREETFPYVDAGGIIGREYDKEVVIDMLLGPNDVQESFRFVTIVGVGGLGKTALAKLVYNDERVVAEFPGPKLRLWVCVSDQDGEQFDVKVILCKILELVSGKRLDYTSSMEFVQKQFQEQLREKKYLLVLDDVWNEDCEKWRNLCRFLTLGQEGSRIVVTTRSAMTAKIIGEKHTHKLQGLSEENSWLLFESVAFDKGEHEHASHLELVEIGKRIVEKCYNIPLAIKVVGSLLFGQPVDKWQTFEHSGLAGTGNGDNEIMSILKLSYHNLIPSLKNCFSCCSVFPKDYRLKRKELISLWIAEGFIASLDRDQSIEDAAEEHFLILVRRCFFQDVEKDEYGDIEYVKMHDLMHDVAQEVGREEIISILNPSYHNLRRRSFSGKKREVSRAHRMSRQLKDIKEELDTTVSNHHKIGISVVDYNPICDAGENQQNHDQANIHVSRSTTSSTNSFEHIPKTISKTLGNRDSLNWVFVVLNVVVEICQATFSQEKNQGKMRPKTYFILSIITSSICLMMAILEMFHEGKGAGIVWRKRGYCCWFHYPGNEGRLFGRISLYFGLISSMIQLIIKLQEKLTNKEIVKFDYIPLLLAICYMVAAIIGTQEKTPSAILIRCNAHSVVEGTIVEGHESRVFQCSHCQREREEDRALNRC